MELRDKIVVVITRTLPPDMVRRLSPERREAFIQELMMLVEGVNGKVDYGDTLTTYHEMAISASKGDNVAIEAATSIAVCGGALARFASAFREPQRLKQEIVDEVAYATFGLVFNAATLTALWDMHFPKILRLCADFMVEHGQMPREPRLTLIHGGKVEEGDDGEVPS